MPACRWAARVCGLVGEAGEDAALTRAHRPRLSLPEHARFSAHSVANGKPAPDLFLHAAASIGVWPAACAVVEDTPSGVQAAVAAGMRAIGYIADSDEGALCEAGAEPLRSLDGLPRLLAHELGVE